MFAIIFVCLCLCLYFLPCFVCVMRDATNFGAVFIINLLFGWTLIGWIAAFIIACMSQTKTSAAIEKETLRRMRLGQ